MSHVYTSVGCGWWPWGKTSHLAILGMVYNTYLWWTWGWFISVLPTLHGIFMWYGHGMFFRMFHEVARPLLDIHGGDIYGTVWNHHEWMGWHVSYPPPSTSMEYHKHAWDMYPGILNIPLQWDDYWMILYMSWTCLYDLGSWYHGMMEWLWDPVWDDSTNAICNTFRLGMFLGIYGIWWDDYDYTATILMHFYVELLYIAYEIVMI